MNSQLREFSKTNLDIKTKIDEVDVLLSLFREIFKIITKLSELPKLLKLASTNPNVLEGPIK
jgi:hypothetical protein